MAEKGSAYIETVLTGQAFKDAKVVLELSARFDALRTATLRGTKSLCLIDEVARRMETVGDWRKSSYSGASGECVEVASMDDVLMVRDTKDRNGTALTVPASAWRAFISTVK